MSALAIFIKKTPEIPESLNNLSVCMVFNSENTDTVKKHLMRATQLNPNYLMLEQI